MPSARPSSDPTATGPRPRRPPENGRPVCGQPFAPDSAGGYPIRVRPTDPRRAHCRPYGLGPAAGAGRNSAHASQLLIVFSYFAAYIPRRRPRARGPHFPTAIAPNSAEASAKGEVMAKVKELHVNGSAHAIDADGDRSLLSVLRDDLGLTGPKYGCGEGQCGACTVLLDGSRVRSCVIARGRGGGQEGPDHRGAGGRRQAPSGSGGVPRSGRLPVRLLHAGHDHVGRGPAEQAARAESGRDRPLHGQNICRCGTYVRIVAAVQDAAKRMKGGAK